MSGGPRAVSSKLNKFEQVWVRADASGTWLGSDRGPYMMRSNASLATWDPLVNKMTNWQIDMTVNITFPQLHWRSVTIDFNRTKTSLIDVTDVRTSKYSC